MLLGWGINPQLNHSILTGEDVSGDRVRRGTQTSVTAISSDTLWKATMETLYYIQSGCTFCNIDKLSLCLKSIAKSLQGFLWSHFPSLLCSAQCPQPLLLETMGWVDIYTSNAEELSEKRSDNKLQIQRQECCPLAWSFSILWGGASPRHTSRRVGRHNRKYSLAHAGPGTQCNLYKIILAKLLCTKTLVFPLV